jgi:hypothetical protein
VSNKYAEFLAFARLASWLEFPVGVLETDTNSSVYTLLVRLPMATLRRRIPRKFFHGYWHHLELLKDETVVDADRADEILYDLARSDLQKRIIIHKGFSDGNKPEG